MTFTLDGKATLPATVGPDKSVKALDDPTLQLDEATVHAGHALFIQCAICHGLNLNSTGSPAPDLRESALAVRRDSFAAVLRAGILPGGMPRFDTLTDEQIDQIHAYIRDGARKALAAPKP